MVIFVSSIGRSGTRYLANLFANCTNVPAYHVAEPYCHGEIYRDVCEAKFRPELEQKAEIIARIERKKGAYFESNQVFMRGLARFFMERFHEIGVVHLLRDPEEVARSYVNRDSYPSHPYRPWRLPLNTRIALLKAPPNLTPFQENLCDWLDNELHYLTLRSQFTRTVDLDFSNFGNAAALERFFGELGVPSKPARIQRHTNALDLDRNPNKVETKVSPSDHQEAISLVPLLLAEGLDVSVFHEPVYRRFPFLQALTGTTGQFSEAG